MAFTAPSGTPIVVGRLKKPEAVFTGGPEHAISYTWQLASNVAIIYPDSRFFGHVDWICKHDGRHLRTYLQTLGEAGLRWRTLHTGGGRAAFAACSTCWGDRRRRFG
jgi:hypothetical protein